MNPWWARIAWHQQYRSRGKGLFDIVMGLVVLPVILCIWTFRGLRWLYRQLIAEKDS